MESKDNNNSRRTRDVSFVPPVVNFNPVINNNNPKSYNLDHSPRGKCSANDWLIKIDRNGRTYYVNIITKESTWSKPLVLATPSEAADMIREKKESVNFFRDMEANILRKHNQEYGSYVPNNEREKRLRSISQTFLPIDEIRSINSYTRSSGGGDYFTSDNDKKGLKSGFQPPRFIRTISSMDDEILDMMKNISVNKEVEIGDCKKKGFPPFNKLARNRTESFHSESKSESNLEYLLEKEKMVRIQKNKQKLSRRNSTGTIYIETTMSAQDNDITIHCVCVVLRAHMIEAARSRIKNDEEFNIFRDEVSNDNNNNNFFLAEEKKSIKIVQNGLKNISNDINRVISDDDFEYKDIPEEDNSFIDKRKNSMENNNESYNIVGRGRLSSCALAEATFGSNGYNEPTILGALKFSAESQDIIDNDVPTLQSVIGYFTDIFVKSQLESECIIMALIYCERLVKDTKGRLCICYDNWKSIVFTCLMMASKVWDDLSMWNVDFSISSSLNLRRVNDLELKLLETLKFIIRVSASEYAKYYFHLRSLISRLDLKKNKPIFQPLDLIGAQKLQLAAPNLDSSKIMDDNRRRSFSQGVFDLYNDENIVSRRTSIMLEEIIHSEHNDADGKRHMSKSNIENKKDLEKGKNHK